MWSQIEQSTCVGIEREGQARGASAFTLCQCLVRKNLASRVWQPHHSGRAQLSRVMRTASVWEL